MDIQRAFTFITDDPDWVTKVGIMLAIALVAPFLLGVPYLLIIGYSIQVAVNARKGVDNVLPEWDELGQKFMDGLMVTLARLVYTLPIWLILCLYITFGGVLGALTSSGNEDVFGALFGGGFLLIFCLIFIFAIALAFINPGIVIQYIRNNNPGSMYSVGAVLGIVRDNIADIGIMLVALIGASLVISFAGGLLNIIPFLGQILFLLITLATAPYLALVSGHMIGQIAAK